MRYLVDTNVLSEATRTSPNPALMAWLATHESELAVDPIILGEISAGILLLPASRKRNALEKWFGQVVETIFCIPWDAPVGLTWAALIAELRRKGLTMPIVDSMIAATAKAHHLTIVTRNTRDFEAAGVKVFNPFA